MRVMGGDEGAGAPKLVPPTRALVVVVAAVATFACGDGSGPESGGPGSAGQVQGSPAGQTQGDPPSGDPSGRISEAELGDLDPDDLDLVLRWTTNAIVAETQSDQTPARTIRSVTYAGVPGADRMVIEFEEDAPLPSHRVESFLEPLPHCAGGDTVRSEGPGLLRVRFSEVASDSATASPPFEADGMGNVTSVHLTCLQESVVEWVLDVETATAYRVLHLSDPTRLVVDVRQPVESSEAESSEDPAGG